MAFEPQPTQNTQIILAGTPTTVVTAPAVGTIRMVGRLVIHNPSTVKHTVTINVGGLQIDAVQLNSLDTYTYPGETIFLDSSQTVEATTNKVVGLNVSTSYADKTP